MESSKCSEVTSFLPLHFAQAFLQVRRRGLKVKPACGILGMTKLRSHVLLNDDDSFDSCPRDSLTSAMVALVATTSTPANAPCGQVRAKNLAGTLPAMASQELHGGVVFGRCFLFRHVAECQAALAFCHAAAEGATAKALRRLDAALTEAPVWGKFSYGCYAGSGLTRLSRWNQPLNSFSEMQTK